MCWGLIWYSIWVSSFVLSLNISIITSGNLSLIDLLIESEFVPLAHSRDCNVACAFILRMRQHDASQCLSVESSREQMSSARKTKCID